MTERSLAPRPAVALVARAVGGDLPRYVTPEEAHRIIDAAQTMTHRLLLKTLWQSGGRVSEVLRLRPCDLARDKPALELVNLKQKKADRPTKIVYVGPDLLAELRALARDARIAHGGYYFRSRQSGDGPMSRSQLARVVEACAQRAGVLVPGRRVGGQTRIGPASALHFRHGAAVHILRSGLPLTLVQTQLGHARIDSTTIYTKLSDPERQALHERIEW